MGLIEKSDIRKLLQDEALVNEIVERSLDDPDVLTDLAGEVADELSDEIESDPELKRKILGRVTKDDIFKKTLLKELIESMS